MDRKSRVKRFVGAGLILVCVGGGAFITSMVAEPQQSHGSAGGNEVPVVSSQGKELLNQFSVAFESAAAKVNPSVVPILSEQVSQMASPFSSPSDPLKDFFGDEFFKRFFGNAQSDQKRVVHALGSGVIVSDDGYILTNNHVVDGAEKLTVILQDKKKYTAKIVGRDPQTDVAVIKIDAKNLQGASLG
ncbi:MAG TPA: trypsin-like peptidase domain-containing protein, partial [Bacteroidota bacterium]